VVGPDLIITVREDEERPAQREPAAQKRDHVERRVVGPMQVLEHHDRAGALARTVERLEQRVEHLAALAIGDPLLEGATDLAGDVVQRPEGAWGQQWVASAPQHPGPRRDRVGERGYERGLAGAGLSGDDRDPAGAGAIREQLRQVGQRSGALQQVHRR
jgi:hypothetical protein